MLYGQWLEDFLHYTCTIMGQKSHICNGLPIRLEAVVRPM